MTAALTILVVVLLFFDGVGMNDVAQAALLVFIIFLMTTTVAAGLAFLVSIVAGLLRFLNRPAPPSIGVPPECCGEGEE